MKRTLEDRISKLEKQMKNEVGRRRVADADPDEAEFRRFADEANDLLNEVTDHFDNVIEDYAERLSTLASAISRFIRNKDSKNAEKASRLCKALFSLYDKILPNATLHGCWAALESLDKALGIDRE